ncbi:hypothetical protein AVEN_152452-1 [Araneus ventricosus]|uniref:Integrase catalytic domain-containing protein n=1 Tax=Araneus ventricosus TaxID=182803 RepID=A0A4Y2TVZ5_ARAVE|nr:hypothetical protein AVEN_152452-1 [Araneus ventricosus]
MPDSHTHIHIDIVGPLPPSEGQIYLLTIIDRFRWPSNTDPRYAVKLYAVQFSIHRSLAGCPSVVASDQGSQLRSSMFVEFTRMLGTQRSK